jgi:hypothetical protein
MSARAAVRASNARTSLSSSLRRTAQVDSGVRPGPGSTRKRPLRQRFLELGRREHQVGDEAHHLLPYEQGLLSAYRFTPNSPRAGSLTSRLDSCIEIGSLRSRTA